MKKNNCNRCKIMKHALIEALDLIGHEHENFGFNTDEDQVLDVIDEIKQALK